MDAEIRQPSSDGHRNRFGSWQDLCPRVPNHRYIESAGVGNRALLMYRVATRMSPFGDASKFPESRRGLSGYFDSCNHARLHQALGYRTPAAVYETLMPRIGGYHGERAVDTLDASRRGPDPGPGDLSPGSVARTPFGDKAQAARSRACR